MKKKETWQRVKKSLNEFCSIIHLAFLPPHWNRIFCGGSVPSGLWTFWRQFRAWCKLLIFSPTAILFFISMLFMSYCPAFTFYCTFIMLSLAISFIDCSMESRAAHCVHSFFVESNKRGDDDNSCWLSIICSHSFCWFGFTRKVRSDLFEEHLIAGQCVEFVAGSMVQAMSTNIWLHAHSSVCDPVRFQCSRPPRANNARIRIDDQCLDIQSFCFVVGSSEVFRFCAR